MDHITVAAFAKDDKFEGFLLVRQAEQRASANGSRYLDMTLCDRTGEINSKLWDGAYAPPKAGTVIKVRALVTEYNGRLQLRVNKMRDAEPADEVDMSLLVPCAPQTGEEMMKAVTQAVSAMQNEVLRRLITEMLAMAGDRLLYFPAAQRLHHAERGGLLHHTTTMLQGAYAMLPVYPWLDRDLLVAGVIAHDLSKITEMRADESGGVSDYTVEGLLLGHLVRGVTQVREAARRAKVENEEYALLLEHMVISHHGEAEYGSPRPPMFPEAEMLHWLDVLDARMNEMNGIVQRTPTGAFSEKIWSLERRVYHPRYTAEAPAGQEAPEGEAVDAPAAQAPEKPGQGKPAPVAPAPAPAQNARPRRPDANAAYQGLL